LLTLINTTKKSLIRFVRTQACPARLWQPPTGSAPPTQHASPHHRHITYRSLTSSRFTPRLAKLQICMILSM